MECTPACSEALLHEIRKSVHFIWHLTEEYLQLWN